MTPETSYSLFANQTQTQDLKSRAGCVEPLTAFPTIVGQVFGNPTVPTAVGQYYSVHAVDVWGKEAEGSAASLSVDTSRAFLVDVIGPKPAVAGDYLICRFVGHRWVADRMGGKGQSVSISIPGCPCSQSPATITMTSSKPSSNNQIFQSAVLQYGPTPSALLPVVLTSSSYLSTATFSDPILNVPFFYFLTCTINSYVLTRVYPSSPFGSPFRDSVRYKWVPGFPGNTCAPFLMTNGQIFLGGDPSCVVTLSQ
jgi:hypothetical protein